MQSFIVVHSTKPKRDEYLEEFVTTHSVSPFDIRRIIGENSLGIEEIREMQKQLYLRPVKGEKKAIILEEAQTLTIEAQNALLKVLEEPPIHAIFFLSTSSTDTLIPTILSRCNLIILKEEKQELSDAQVQLLEDDLKLLFSHSISARLSLAEKVASQKEEIGKWLQSSTMYLRQIMLTDLATNHTPNTTIFKNLQEAYRLITTTNTNPRVVLEHAFLLC
jgi:hypothetical protein